MTTAAIQQVRLATQDVEQGHEFIKQVYVDCRLQMSGSSANFVYSSDLLLLGEVFLGRIEHSMAVNMKADHGGDVVTIFQAR